MPEKLTLWVVIFAGLIDSINPCALGVLIFLSSVLLKVSPYKKMLIKLGIIYVLTVFFVYLLSGMGLIWFQGALIQAGLTGTIGVIVGGIVIILGLIELKDFFWYRKWVSLEIPQRYKNKIQQMSSTISVVGIITLGGFVAIVELPCTGGPYLAITALLARSFDTQAMFYLILYNLIIVVPLIVILVLIYFGASTLKLKKWRETNRKWMNLSMGLLMITLGIFLVLYYKLRWFL